MRYFTMQIIKYDNAKFLTNAMVNMNGGNHQSRQQHAQRGKETEN